MARRGFAGFRQVRPGRAGRSGNPTAAGRRGATSLGITPGVGITARTGIAVGIAGTAAGARLGPWTSRAVHRGRRRPGVAARPLPRGPVLLSGGPGGITSGGITSPAAALPRAASRGRPVPFRPLRRPGHGRLPLPHPPGADLPRRPAPRSTRCRRSRRCAASRRTEHSGTASHRSRAVGHPRRPRRLSDGRPGTPATAGPTSTLHAVPTHNPWTRPSTAIADPHRRSGRKCRHRPDVRSLTAPWWSHPRRLGCPGSPGAARSLPQEADEHADIGPGLR